MEFGKKKSKQDCDRAITKVSQSFWLLTYADDHDRVSTEYPASLVTLGRETKWFGSVLSVSVLACGPCGKDCQSQIILVGLNSLHFVACLPPYIIPTCTQL